MKSVLELNGRKFILSMDAMERIANALAQAQWLEHKYVGKESPSNYIDVFTPFQLHDVLKVGVMDEDTHGALELASRLHHDKKA